MIIVGHDDESLERLVRTGGKKGQKVFMKLVEKIADLRQRSRDRMKFCQMVETRLLVVMARMIDDKPQSRRTR